VVGSFGMILSFRALTLTFFRFAKKSAGGGLRGGRNATAAGGLVFYHDKRGPGTWGKPLALGGDWNHGVRQAGAPKGRVDN